MHEAPSRAPRKLSARALVLALVCTLGTALGSPIDAAVAHIPAAAPSAFAPAERPFLAPAASVQGRWAWPLAGRRVIARAFLAPPHAYGPGHRGIDLRADDGERGSVLAPADGVVAFAGVVADRSLLTIDHGNGLVSTLEPVEGDLEQGQHVSRGDVVGQLATGGHAAAGSLHLGVRLNGEYVNPLLLLGDVPRARLLPLE